MLTACLGWGSLVWDPRELPVRGTWFRDGPFLPIEFARQSSDGRMTLVIMAGTFPLLRSLWAPLSVGTLAEAREALRKREGVWEKNAEVHISHWERGQAAAREGAALRIERWAETLGLAAVVWTNLPPKFGDEDGRIPTEREAVAYLRELEGKTRERAEEYVRKAPRQINTDYRRAMELQLKWTTTGEV